MADPNHFAQCTAVGQRPSPRTQMARAKSRWTLPAPVPGVWERLHMKRAGEQVYNVLVSKEKCHHPRFSIPFLPDNNNAGFWANNGREEWSRGTSREFESVSNSEADFRRQSHGQPRGDGMRVRIPR